MKKIPIHKMKDCKYCRFPFVPTSASSKYCSKEHRDADYRDRGLFAEAQRRLKDKEHIQKFHGAQQCIVCGLWYRAVCHHAWQRHELSEAEYKKIAGLDHKKGLIPSELKALKRDQVFENGTVENLKKGTKQWFKKGDRTVGKYERSPQTMKRLRLQGLKISGKL